MLVRKVGQHDDRYFFRFWIKLKNIQCLKTIHFWHHDIKKNDVRLHFLRFCMTILSIIYSNYLKTFFGKQVLVQARFWLIVLNEEYFRHILSLYTLCPFNASLNLDSK